MGNPQKCGFLGILMCAITAPNTKADDLRLVDPQAIEITKEFSSEFELPAKHYANIQASCKIIESSGKERWGYPERMTYQISNPDIIAKENGVFNSDRLVKVNNPLSDRALISEAKVWVTCRVPGDSYLEVGIRTNFDVGGGGTEIKSWEGDTPGSPCAGYPDYLCIPSGKNPNTYKKWSVNYSPVVNVTGLGTVDLFQVTASNVCARYTVEMDPQLKPLVKIRNESGVGGPADCLSGKMVADIVNLQYGQRITGSIRTTFILN